jgi:hypothetical protein
VRVKEQIEALAGGQFAALAMALKRLGTAACHGSFFQG